MKKEKLKKKILEEYNKGNIVISTCDGLAFVNVDEFIKQPTEGLLYDLNRSPEVVCTFLDDPKWINDYAVAVVISKLKDKITSLENKESILPHTIHTSQNMNGIFDDCL